MSKRILIAEDDTFIRKLFEMNLVRDSWEVELVINGEKAIEAIERQPPDLLLLDLLMPVVNGFGVLEHVKEKGHHFPVIILSNLSQEIDKKKAQELGASNFFIKSDMDIDVLADTIETMTD